MIPEGWILIRSGVIEHVESGDIMEYVPGFGWSM